MLLLFAVVNFTTKAVKNVGLKEMEGFIFLTKKLIESLLFLPPYCLHAHNDFNTIINKKKLCCFNQIPQPLSLFFKSILSNRNQNC